VVASQLWAKLADKHSSIPLAEQQEAAKGLTERDLKDLLKRLGSDSAEEQYAALGIFLQAVRGNNEFLRPLLAQLQEKATRLAEGWAIETPPPPSDKDAVMRWTHERFTADVVPDVPARAYYLLAAIDRESAAQFLHSHFQYENLSSYEREQVIHDFAELCSHDKSKCSETALRRLMAVAEQGEPEATKAAAYLIGRQLIRRSEVEKVTQKWRNAAPHELTSSAVSDFIGLLPRFAGREEELTKQANEWLETKSVAALNSLYWDFISQLPEGAPVGPLLGILGAPNWWEDHPHVYNFSSDEGPALQIHLTSDRKIGGLRLK
jgi:hypothetical protein